MPFDSPTMPRTAREDRRSIARPVGYWLLVICAMLLVMIVLGGVTRITGSGLSIMEWAPVSGALPPLSEAEWQRLYQLYRQIPQYALVNDGFGLAGFKHIFWLEWAHRLWGRLIGLAFMLPLLVFAVRGLVTRRLAIRLGMLFVLGGLQGAVGWFMVASGFVADSTAVSPYRLVVHLTLALVLYSAILWTALSILASTPQGGTIMVRRWAAATAVSVALTIVAGGFVAGRHAGLAYNTFPLMDGTLPPPGYGALSPWLRNLTENVAAVQFDHRLLATVTSILALGTVAIGLWSVRGRARVAVAAVGVAVAGQYALGVATLVYVVPPVLGAAHQAMAILVLSATLTLLHTQRRIA